MSCRPMSDEFTHDGQPVRYPAAETSNQVGAFLCAEAKSFETGKGVCHAGFESKAMRKHSD